LVAAVDGAGLEVIFNVRYLTDVLAVIDTEDVALELNTPDKPGVIKPNGASGGDYIYIIMPMHNAR
jgi:DNA polymerase-3 subunit beta